VSGGEPPYHLLRFQKTRLAKPCGEPELMH